MINGFLFLALQLVQQDFSALPKFNHSIDWQTIETRNFYIHFPPTLENPAHRLAQLVEPVRARLTQKFAWEPSGKVHVVITDFSDESNGLSTPVPYNVIYLYIAPPTDDSSLDDYDDWLKMLFTHEFTHTVHIDQARGPNSVLRKIFGQIIVPNAAQQQWGLEGLAELEETLETTRGRGRSPFVEMYLRTVSLEDQFLPIDSATYYHDEYPLGNAAYFYGIGFYQYLMKKYGEEKIYELTRETSSSLIPAFFNFKTKPVFQKSFTRLWDEWRAEQKSKWHEFRLEHPTKSLEKSTLAAKERMEGLPAFDDTGRTLYVAIVNEKVKAEIRAFHFDENGKSTSEKITDGILPGRLFYNDGFLYYSKMTYLNPYETYSDIYALDLKTKKAYRLTRGLRLRDPIVSDGKIIAVRNDALKASLVTFSIPANFTSDDWESPISDPDKLEVLFEANGYDTLAKPALSPDKSWLAFSMREENKGRHLFLLNLKNKKVLQITNQNYDDYHPVFSPDGSHLLFSSARPLGESTKSQNILVTNIFSLRLSDGQIKPVTDVITGANWPTLGKDRLAFGHFRSTGYELQSFKYKADTGSLALAASFKTLPISEQKPQILPEGATQSGYKRGKSLLPHYLLPFFFFTESDSAIGAVTGSFDPLQTHFWNGVAYYLTAPRRPGGALSYVYNGFKSFSLQAGVSGGITDYGHILAVTGSSSFQEYYERDIYAYLGASLPINTKNGPTGFSFADSVFVEKRDALLGFPVGTVSGIRDVTLSNGTTHSGVVMRPEEGLQWGNLATVTYQTKFQQTSRGESPSSGTKAQVSVEYTPKVAGSDFETLTYLASGKSYYEITDGHYLAGNATFGLQTLEPLYQRTFQLGGSFGESPFQSLNKRLYPLRGLPTGDLRGEGLVAGSVEYRFALLRHMPGFGTAPIWFKNLHAGIFADGGQTFEWKNSLTLLEVLSKRMEKFSWDRFSLSSGIELRSHVSLTYAPPLQFRLGYAQMLYKLGEWIGKDRVSQVYFTAGTSF